MIQARRRDSSNAPGPFIPGPGSAALRVDRVDGASAITRLWSTHPVRLLAPRQRGPSAWVYATSFGGGLVSGDETRITIEVGPGAKCFLGTPASTKVYRRHEGGEASQSIEATIAKDGILVLMPDPVQPFAHAAYLQRQQFHLEPGAGLVWVDGLHAGRTACGERWAFARYRSRTEIRVGGHRILLDAMELDPRDGPLTGPYRMGRFNALVTVGLVGPNLAARAERWIRELADLPFERRAGLIMSASPLPDGVVLRLAGERPEELTPRVRQFLDFLPELLGEDPFSRRP